MKRWLYFGLVFLSAVPLWAQAESGAIFMLIPPSPQMNGMGSGTGVGLPVQDPYTQFINPANGVSTAPGLTALLTGYSTHWLDSFPYGYRIGSLSWAPSASPWKLGMSYQTYSFDFGQAMWRDTTTGAMHPYDLGAAGANLGTVATGYQDTLWTIPVSFTVGLGGKHVFQHLGRSDSSRSSNWWWDWGVLFSSPWEFPLPVGTGAWRAHLQPSLGYSMTNIGSEVEMLDASRPDPAPRTARLGWGIEVTLRWKSAFNLLQFRGTRAVEDLLVQSVHPVRYQHGLGDIDVWKHLMRNHASTNVTVSHGREWRIAGIYAWRRGRYQNQDGQLDMHTRGYGVYPLEALRLLNRFLRIPMLTPFLHHIDLQYNHAEYWNREWYSSRPVSTFGGWTLRFTHLETLF